MKRIWILAVALTLLPQIAAAQYHDRNNADDRGRNHSTYDRAYSRISMDEARRIAFERVGRGKVKSQRFEQVNNEWVYAFDISLPHHGGMEAVIVDPYSGEVIWAGQERHKGDWRDRTGEWGYGADRKGSDRYGTDRNRDRGRDRNRGPEPRSGPDRDR